VRTHELFADSLIRSSLRTRTQAGVFLFAMGLLRFGFLDSVLSRPLLAGFINAVAVTIVLEQVRTTTPY
jgi:MFS superfamily sulfate permease-like transporter